MVCYIFYRSLASQIYYENKHILERVNMPVQNEEKAVVPTHILGPNTMYVQLSCHMGQFNNFQFNQLQNIQLKELKHLPGIRSRITQLLLNYF